MTAKILKRKDAASIIVAIVVAMIIVNMLTMMSFDISARITDFGTDKGMGGDFEGYPGPFGTWKVAYLQPAVSAALQIIALEVLLWAYVFVAGVFKKKR